MTFYNVGRESILSEVNRYKRNLYPNVDFYSGLLYEAMNIPSEMFTVMFAIGRMSGWLAQWEEMLQDDELKIARPRQIYLGRALRHIVD